MPKQKTVDMKLSEASATMLLEAALEKTKTTFGDFIMCIQLLESFVDRLKDFVDPSDKVLVKMAQDQIEKFRSK